MSKWDDTLLNSVAAATIKTLQDLCKTPVSVELPYFNKGEKEQPSFAIAGLIGLTSAKVRGSIALCFPEAVFLALMEQILGEKMTEIRQENEDAAAELLNIIFGKVKAVLNKRGYELQMAIPSVLRGNLMQSHYDKVHAVRVMPFKTPAGTFYVEFLLHPLAGEKAEPQDQTQAAPLTPAAQAAFFKPFMDATVKTLGIQCSLQVQPGKPFVKKSSGDYTFDIGAVIGITSRALNGSFMLTFKNDLFLKLMSKMLGEPITEFQPGLEDGVSEMVNIILGTAKAVLNAEGHGIQMAIPTVVHGDSIVASFQPKRRAIVTPFSSELGDFFVEATIQE